MMQFITVKGEDGLFRVHLNDVEYIKRKRRKTYVATDYGLFLSREGMPRIREMLDARFFDVTRYMIVNFEKVKYMCDRQICFRDDSILATGRDSFRKAQNSYRIYRGNSKNPLQT